MQLGNQKRPVLEELQKEKEVAETEYLEKEKIYNQLRIDNKDDREIFDTLSSRLEERKINRGGTCQNRRVVPYDFRKCQWISYGP